MYTIGEIYIILLECRNGAEIKHVAELVIKYKRTFALDDLEAIGILFQLFKMQCK
tara:strand:- start:168 stop:332 length:165 start_codon:yes stop_codon:yes gene_type:complete